MPKKQLLGNDEVVLAIRNFLKFHQCSKYPSNLVPVRRYPPPAAKPRQTRTFATLAGLFPATLHEGMSIKTGIIFQRTAELALSPWRRDRRPASAATQSASPTPRAAIGRE
jgi:hypothetical protein